MAAPSPTDSTPLQQAKYLVRWDYLGNSYYAGANVPAGGTPTFFSGTVNTAEGLQAAGGTAQYGNTYSAQTPATGRVNTARNIDDDHRAVVGGGLAAGGRPRCSRSVRTP